MTGITTLTDQALGFYNFLNIFSEKLGFKVVMLFQEEEEAAEGATQAEREGGAKDGPARCLYCRYRGLIHVLPRHHQEAAGEHY